MTIKRRLLTLEQQPDRLEQVIKRLGILNKRQRQDYMDTLPDDVLEDFITKQTGIPRGKLSNKMLEAIAKGEEQ